MDYDLWLRIFKENKCLYCPKALANFRIWPVSKTVSQEKEMWKESEFVRRKYGGSIFDPAVIHRLRTKIIILEIIKNKYPGFFSFGKKIIYSIAEVIKKLNVSL